MGWVSRVALLALLTGDLVWDLGMGFFGLFYPPFLSPRSPDPERPGEPRHSVEPAQNPNTLQETMVADPGAGEVCSRVFRCTDQEQGARILLKTPFTRTTLEVIY